MGTKPVASVVWRMLFAGAFLFPVEFSCGQSPHGSADVEALRVNAYLKFIIANTYLFEEDAHFSYLYAYDPLSWDSVELEAAPYLRVLEPGADSTAWWSEPPFRVVELDSYTACADSKDELRCIGEKGAYLASGRKHPELEHEGLFVIKEAPVENPSETSDSSPQANAE